MLNKLGASDLQPLYDKRYICHLCKKPFTNKNVRSRFVKPIQVDSDYGPVFKPDEVNNPLYYYIAVCPHCGFPFAEDFSAPQGDKVREIVKEKITEKIKKPSDYGGKRDFAQAVNAYKLAIYAAQLTHERHIVLARICHRLAWLFRGRDDKTEEKRFLQLAASEYELSYVHTDSLAEDMPEIAVLYVIGELNQRLGNYHAAIKFFSIVVEHPDRSRYMKYVKKAREQWKIAAEKYRCQQDDTKLSQY